MNKNEQMIVRKVSFWNKIKEKFRMIFWKKNNKVKNDNYEIYSSKNKKDIMEIYNKVKNNNINLDSLDSDTLYKIMLLLKKELEITSKKLKEEFNQTTVHLYNLKMYNKQIELLKKDS